MAPVDITAIRGHVLKLRHFFARQSLHPCMRDAYSVGVVFLVVFTPRTQAFKIIFHLEGFWETFKEFITSMLQTFQPKHFLLWTNYSFQMPISTKNHVSIIPIIFNLEQFSRLWTWIVAVSNSFKISIFLVKFMYGSHHFHHYCIRLCNEFLN